ncbi:toprim domain-containing protein [Bacillus sp. T33-2]|uniref:toprim domain-containing protein n=1 Tax=Bacillus sp. T33-2 TaxID=2054168 RepID=UPI000C78F330|nr:toprim domain-containing protein [Bacillus sp. T33-2]PLR99518.1 DNA primase [Bacillus sp. T33-2]
MDAQELKERIIMEEKIDHVLEQLGMHSIKEHDEYFSCGMPDGSRKNSTIIYKDSLYVDAHTRNIKDKYGISDIISLVTFIKGTYFSESIKWICDICSFDYYQQDNIHSGALQWINSMWKIHKEGSSDDDEKVEPIDENILKYFGRYGNPLFFKDGINYETQWEFGLGFDLKYHMITIPIRDEIGTLCGIKGRLYKEKIDEGESKYFYIQPCAKSSILYGLDKTKNFIKQKNEVIVVESEKAVLQLWSLGIKNAVAISGHKLSKSQVKKLTHLNVPIVIAYDEGCEIGKDGNIDKSFYRDEFSKFLEQQTVYCIYDKTKKILNKKESPSDDPEKWQILYDDYKIKVRGE